MGGEEVTETGVGRRISGIAGGHGEGRSCLASCLRLVNGRVESFCAASLLSFRERALWTRSSQASTQCRELVRIDLRGRVKSRQSRFGRPDLPKACSEQMESTIASRRAMSCAVSTRFFTWLRFQGKLFDLSKSLDNSKTSSGIYYLYSVLFMRDGNGGVLSESIVRRVSEPRSAPDLTSRRMSYLPTALVIYHTCTPETWTYEPAVTVLAPNFIFSFGIDLSSLILL